MIFFYRLLFNAGLYNNYNMDENKPTLKEIAQNTGFSISTISRALTNPSMVKVSTRRKIEKAIIDVQKNYVEKRTGMVAFIVPDVTNPFFPSMLAGINNISAFTDFTMLLCSSDGNPKNEDKILQKLLNTGIDGIIFITSGKATQYTEQLVKDNVIPIVFLDRDPGIEGVNIVSTGNHDGMYQATRYLITLGHKRILYLGGRPNASTNTERFEGFSQAMHEAYGDASLSSIYADYNLNKAYTAINNMIKTDSFNYSAICSANDLMALGAIKALNEAHIRVPEDVSVIGYDDIPLADYSGLTTIKQPFVEMGQNAMYQLNSLINDYRAPAKHIYLPTNIVFRSTCAINKSE